MEENKNIIGCFVSGQAIMYNDNEDTKVIVKKKNELFRSYIWGENRICDVMKKLNRDDYGKDLNLILFQFYLNPLAYELGSLKEIESYRKNEKSIGIPIIIDDQNFFSKLEEERYTFLKECVLQKIDLLTEVVKKKKLDTNIELLKSDLRKLF